MGFSPIWVVSSNLPSLDKDMQPSDEYYSNEISNYDISSGVLSNDELFLDVHIVMAPF